LSIALSEKTFFTVTTDANGSANFTAYPLPIAQYRKATTIVADVVTVAGADVPSANYTADIANMAGVRIVSYGVRVITICPQDVAAGIARVSTLNGHTAFPDFADISHETRHLGLTGGKDFTWIGTPRGSSSHVFYAPNRGIADFGGTNEEIFPWTLCDVFVSGGPASTAIFAVEIVTNYECLPSATQSHENRATKAAPSSVTIREAIANYHAQAQHIFEGVENAGGFAAGSYALKQAPGIFNSIKNWFGGGSLAETAMEGIEMLAIL
jgi:hypothetical protein